MLILFIIILFIISLLISLIIDLGRKNNKHKKNIEMKKASKRE